MIWGALLPAARGTRRAPVDLLVRVPEGGYVPVVVVRHRITDPGEGAATSSVDRPWPRAAAVDRVRGVRSHPRDLLRLAHLHRLLRAAGWAPERAAPHGGWGGVIGFDADVVVWHDLWSGHWPGDRSTFAEYDERVADRMAVATAAAERAPALAQPSRITECRHCPWWSTCEAALTRAKDVSLVVRVRRRSGCGKRASPRWPSWRRRIRGASCPCPGCRWPTRSRSPGRGWRDVDGAPGAAGAGATRRRRGRRRPGELPGTWRVSVGCAAGLPGRPTRIHPSPRVSRVRDVGSGADADEARSFAEFWTWLQEVRARPPPWGGRFAAYCYFALVGGPVVARLGARFRRRPGVPTVEEVRAFIVGSAVGGHVRRRRRGVHHREREGAQEGCTSRRLRVA